MILDFVKKAKLRTGEMAMRVGSLATLPEDLGSVPQDPCGCLQPSTPPVLEDLTSTSVGTTHTWWTDIQAGKASIHLKINKIKK